MAPRRWCAVPRFAVPLSLAVVAAACERGAQARPSAPVDGVPVVENQAAAWGEARTWRVEPVPVLQVGAVDGDTAQAFGGVSDAVRLSDGTLVVADWQAPELRWFGADGRHLRRVGRRGGGPGEFRNLAWLAVLPGDSVAAYDPDQGRVSVFARDGVLGREVSLAAREDEMPLEVRAVLSDGTLLVTRLLDGAVRVGEGVSRRPMLLARRAEGQPLRALGRFRDREIVGLETRTGGMHVRANMNVDFGAATHFAAGAGRVYAGDSERYEIVQYDERGRPVRRIRRRVAPQAVTDADRHEALFGVRRRSRRQGQGGGAVRSLRERAPFPGVKAAFAGLAVDRAGHLWVRRYADAGGPVAHDVFDGEGRFLGTVELPHGTRLLDVGADHLVAAVEDELGVQHVRVHRILKE